MTDTGEMSRASLFGWGLTFLLALTPFGTAIAQTCLQPPQGLVSWWPGEGDAADIADSNSGTLNGGAAFAPGIVGQAFSFNGSDASVDVPYNVNLNIQKELTIDAWVMKTGPCKNNCIVGLKQDDFVCCSSYRYGLLIFGIPGVAPGRATLSFNTGSWEDVVISNTVLQDNVWYHLAGTYDGQTAKIYVNGLLDNAVSKSGSIVPSTQGSLFIGQDEGGFGDEERFEGLIDELEIYRRALSAEEVAAIFSAGGTGKCKVTSVRIDIKPGSFPNSINPKSKGRIPVAILAISARPSWQRSAQIH
jgi:Concanavalin A-like lectin/glucanases superfamily